MEPITSTVIVTLAFTKFLETTVEKFTETGLQKMDELRQKIWAKLKGNAKAEEALKGVEEGKKEKLKSVEAYLTVAMDDDENFAAEVENLASEIQSLKLQDNSSMNQYIYEGGTGYQTKVEGGTVYQGTTHYYSKVNEFYDKTIQLNTTERPIWEVVSELGKQISDQEWEKVPTDLSKNFDDYQQEEKDKK